MHQEEGRVGAQVDFGPTFDVCGAIGRVRRSRGHFLLRLVCLNFLDEEAWIDARLDLLQRADFS